MKHRDEHRRIALPPIPEASPENAQGCTEGDAPNLDCTESTQNSADTPVAGKDRTHEEDSAHGCTAPPPQAPKKIHPDMLEQLDLLGRLERLELLERLAHKRMTASESGLAARAHEEGDSVVSMASTTKSSSLRTPTRDRKHPEDGHAPPSERDQARWASAGGAAGVSLHRQHHELVPASPASCTSLALMVTKSESVKLHTAVALYNSGRQRTPADDAGAPSTPAARSRSSSPLPSWTPMPKGIPGAKDCPGPHGGRSSVHDAPTWQRSDPEIDLSSASAMTQLPGEHCDGEDEERKAPAWTKFEEPREEWPLSPSLSHWPQHQKAHGKLTLKSFAEQRNSRQAVCSIQHGVLTLHITQRDSHSRDSPCAGRRQRNTAAGTTVKVPLGELGVGLQQGRGDMFTIATLHEQSMHDDEICCFAHYQAERDKWIAIFERMGVPIFHSSCAEAPARCTLTSQEH